MFPLSLVLALAVAPPFPGFPSASIANEQITVKLYLPDSQSGYYRGTRFDWSGQIGSLRTAQHEYFGQWFERYDPKLHDAIQGPVEEFDEVGFAAAKPGELFLRVGVGLVRRPDEKPYDRFRTYEIADAGSWRIRRGRDWIAMTHTLRGAGFGYRYTKTLRLAGRDLLVEHELRNTGAKDLVLTQYNHQFFMMDGKPSGPETIVEFPFALKATRAPSETLAAVSDGTIRYKRELQKGESVFGIFGGAPAPGYDIRVARRDTEAAVRIRSDRPIESLVFWSIRTTVCPEPYVRVDTAAGKRTRWSYRYTFE